MKIGDKLLKQLNKKYQPSSTINQRFGRYDISMKTNPDGDPLLLFIGQSDAEGRIRGERFARVLVKDPSGKVIKDHWDNKGKAN